MTEIQLLKHMLKNAADGLPVGTGILNRYGHPIANTELAVIDLCGWRELQIPCAESETQEFAPMTEIQLLKHMLKNAENGFPVGTGILDRYGDQIADPELAVIDLCEWKELQIPETQEPIEPYWRARQAYQENQVTNIQSDSNQSESLIDVCKTLSSVTAKKSQGVTDEDGNHVMAILLEDVEELLNKIDLLVDES